MVFVFERKNKLNLSFLKRVISILSKNLKPRANFKLNDHMINDV